MLHSGTSSDYDFRSIQSSRCYQDSSFIVRITDVHNCCLLEAHFLTKTTSEKDNTLLLYGALFHK